MTQKETLQELRSLRKRLDKIIKMVELELQGDPRRDQRSRIKEKYLQKRW